MKITDMAHWPGTPGGERMLMADHLIQEQIRQEQEDPEHTAPWDEPGELSAVHDDARMMLGYTDIWLFSLGAHEEMEQLIDAEQINSNMDLLPLAARGSDDRFIGTLIDLGEPPRDRLDENGNRIPADPGGDEDDGEYGVMLTCLHRNPEWVGLNEQLQWCRGLEVHVFCRKEQPRDPHVIIAVRPGNMVGERGVEMDEETDGLIGVIRDVVLWHGAVKCVWHTNSPRE